MRAFDILLAKVDFDNEDDYKVRPVLCLDKEGDTIIARKMTSNNPRPNYPGEYLLKDWKQENLHKASTVRMSKHVKLPNDYVLKVIGHLSQRDEKEIRKLLDTPYKESYNIDDEIEDLYYNYDAGDVSQGVAFFNTSVSEEVSMHKYSYTGPVYRFDNYFDEVFKPIITSAPSIDKAMSNIIFRLKQKYDLKPGTNLTIDKDRIEEVETPSDDNIKHDYCPECGYMLTDNGECPICDYGEEDLLEADNNEVVYSNETDSLGNKLSVEQARYFSNSKIRDNSGKLLVCHHGSDVTDILVFDTSKPSSFFTTDRGYAQDYANKSDTEGKIYDVYLNITNPIDLSTKEQLRFIQEKYLPWAQEHNIELPKELIMGKNVPFNDLADGLFMFLKEDRSYDGIIVNEGVEYAINKGRYSKAANTSYLPLYSNQIKLITNTTPTKDDNIDEEFYNCINI